MIGVDWIAGLPTTAAGLDMIQNYVDLLSGKLHAVPTHSTATATDAAVIIRDMCLRSGTGFPDALVMDHDAKFTSEVFRAFVKGWGSCLIVGPAYHENTNAKAERANGVVRVSDTLRAYADGRKDDWDSQLRLAIFAVNNTASTLGDAFVHRLRRTPPFPTLASLPRPCRRRAAGALRERNARNGGDGAGAARAADRMAKLDAGRVDLVQGRRPRAAAGAAGCRRN